jgi:hypothetical protein
LTFIPNNHPNEDRFENYTLGKLSEIEGADFEEHLLICESCQRTLAEIADYVRLMKVATAAYVRGREGARRRGVRRHTAAAAVLLLTCLTALFSWRTPSGEPRTIVLDAYRGAPTGALAEAPAGQPLDLQIDLREVQPAASYRVEVVDSTGRQVWSGATPVRLTKGLSPGTYWVRLSSDAGKPLREYGLNLRNLR